MVRVSSIYLKRMSLRGLGTKPSTEVQGFCARTLANIKRFETHLQGEVEGFRAGLRAGDGLGVRVRMMDLGYDTGCG